MSSSQGFPDYVAQTNESGVALYAFVLIYTILSFLLIAPLVVCGRKHRDEELFEADEAHHLGGNETQGLEPADPGQLPPQRRENSFVGLQPLRNTEPANNGNVRPPSASQLSAAQPTSEGNSHAHTEPVRTRNRLQHVQGGILRQLDRYATSSYPDDNADFVASAISGSSQSRAQDSVVRDSSSTPSAATTSRIHARATQYQPRTKVWDVHGKRWKGRRPVGRADTIHRAIQTEANAMASSTARAQGAPCSSGRVTPPLNRGDSARVVSRGVGNANGVRSRRPRGRRGSSFSSAESGSILPFLVDDITPNDAADAGDPGRRNPFENGETGEVTLFCGQNALWKPPTLIRAIDEVADIANPDGELKRILALSIPLTLGAVSDSVFQAIIVAVISQSIGTDSTAAFVLVSMFLGLSDDLVGAIADAESALCAHAFSMGDMHMTGQYVQLAICVHLIVDGAIMAVWVLYVDSVIEWLVASPEIASIALSYTQIAVFQHLLQSLSRTVSSLFHLFESENFETQCDFFEGLFTLIMVACFLPSFGGATLNSVGWIQLSTAIIAFVVKVVHAITRGCWSPLFWRGLTRDCAFRNQKAVKQLLSSSLPLFIGAFLEYGEWELLVVFVAYLGPAEVVAWALLGVIWKVLESSIEGIGEAAGIRVAFHLGTGHPNKARMASYKSWFIAVVQALLATSTLFMIGKNLATWLTTDVTLQNMLNDVIPLVGLGNLVMNFALICWNLVGSQGRYRLATLVILLTKWLVTVPLAAVFSYALMLDLSGMMAAVILAYDIACMALAYILLRSDWTRLSRTMQDMDAIIGDESSDDDAESDQEGEELDELRGTKQDE